MCIIAEIFMCIQCTLRAADLELPWMSTVPAGLFFVLFQKLLKCIVLIATGIKLRVDFQGDSGFDVRIWTMLGLV